MIDRPTFRASQDVHARTKQLGEDDIEADFRTLVASLSGELPPSVESARERFAHDDSLSAQAALGYNDDFAIYEAGDILVERLREHGIGHVLSRIGIHGLIRYDPYHVITREDVKEKR